MLEKPIDAVVVGAGPAGLSAAIYLARYRRSFIVAEDGVSRAANIPKSHNHPGFPDGIPGPELLQRMKKQALKYGASFHECSITKLEMCDRGFRLVSDRGELSARTILLATGVLDKEPNLPGLTQAVRRGLIRHCGICDGFEAIDRKIGVIGHGASGLGEALFLRNYSSQITLLSLGESIALADRERQILADAQIKVVEDAVCQVVNEGDTIVALTLATGASHEFDVLYSALGCEARSELAVDLGADVDERRCVIVDAHQQSSVPGLFAAGDVVRGLDQISVAMGHAAIAATAIHNRLRDSV